MKFAFTLVAAVAADQPSFEEWAAEYGLNGVDNVMKAKYNANVAQINKWNADESETATFAVNQFSAMSFDEFSAQYLTATPLETSDMPMFETVAEEHKGLTKIDWDVTPVKDQGQCGSCWAFGTFGAVEHIHKLNSGATVSLAEQQLVDCDTVSSGCDGGRPDWACNYLTGKDIYTTASYPYTASDGTCTTGEASGVTVTGYNTVGKSDGALASALGTSAVTVMVYADSKFQSYSSGVMSDPPTTCSLNHAVLATGYDSNYWKIKNSWGTGWGEAGFIRFARLTDGCGAYGLFYDNPVVPTVGGAPSPTPAPPTPTPPAPTPTPPTPTPTPPTPSPTPGCADNEDAGYCAQVVSMGYCADIGYDCLATCGCCDDPTQCGGSPSPTPTPAPTPTPPTCVDTKDAGYCAQVVSLGYCADIGYDCLATCGCCDDATQCGAAVALSRHQEALQFQAKHGASSINV